MTAQEAAALAAFRKVTGWSDELVLHYAGCETTCTPICGHEEEDCPEAARIQDTERALTP